MGLLLGNSRPFCLGGFIGAARAVGAFAVTAAGSKLRGGERNARKHFAGVFRAAGAVAAFLGGDGVVENGNDQLRIALQTDDRELTQCYIQTAALAGEHQLIVKHAADGSGQLQSCIVAALAVADILNLGAEHHWIEHFDYSSGTIGVNAGQTVGLVQPGIGAVNVGTAVFSAQDGALGENGQAIQRSRARSADGGVSQNAVVESDVDAIMVLIEGYRFDGGLLRLENFRRRFLRFRHYLRCYRPRLQS